MPHTQPSLSPGDGARPSTPAVVLDTNVVLDWLLFRDAACAGLSSRLNAGQLRWHATSSMRSELSSVLPRRQLQSWSPDCEHILSVFDRFARVCPDPPSTSAPSLRCRDRDDQKFIDLAIAVGAQWLFSKDRALLALARPARARGVEVLTPGRWQRQAVAPHGSR
jgi:putative PIN family toxin of toxin-antitoxin system